MEASELRVALLCYGLTGSPPSQIAERSAAGVSLLQTSKIAFRAALSSPLSGSSGLLVWPGGDWESARTELLAFELFAAAELSDGAADRPVLIVRPTAAAAAEITLNDMRLP